MQCEELSAVVTGAAHGIGRALCAELVGRRCRVTAVDLDAAALRDLAAELGDAIEPATVDVSDAAAVEALAERLGQATGGIRLLVNNAGVSVNGPAVSARPGDLDWVLGVNLAGVVHGCVSFGQRMVRSGAPSWIVNTGSEHGLGVPHEGAALYTASKHAVLGYSDVLRRELPDHVGVSVLCPGLTATELWRSGERRPERLGGPVEGHPRAAAVLGRGMDAGEVARRTLAGVEAGEFLIPTHSHMIDFARERWEEVEGAFARQAPRRKGDERYDVRRVVAELRNAAGSGEAAPAGAPGGVPGEVDA